MDVTPLPTSQSGNGQPFALESPTPPETRTYLRQEDDSQDLGNQLPTWISEVLPSGEENQSPPTQSGSTCKRGHNTLSSSDQSSQSPQPPKRRRARSYRSSSSDGNVPKWAREITSSNVGPSEQAQPTNIPSAERTKSSSNGGSGQAQTEQTPSPNKSITFSQTVSSSQSGTLSGASGTNTWSGGPNTSSSSGTTSSGSGYPPSSSHSLGSPEGPPSNDHRGGGEGSSQQPPSDSSESSKQSKDKKDSLIDEENKDTNASELDNSTAQESVKQSSLDQTSQIKGTQDSFFKKKDNSSREGRESSYIGGSSSVSFLASVSPNKSTPGSLSTPLASISDSQETLESSVSCIEDSVPLPNTVQTCSKLNSNTHNTQAVPSSDNEVACSSKLKVSDSSPKQGENNPETSEDQINAAEVSSELLPLLEEPPHSPELLNNDIVEDGKRDSTDSPVIALQAPKLPRDSNGANAVDRAESPVIALQSPPSKRAISEPAQLIPMEADLEGEPESSQAMDTDMISTQNSFILQLADSQSTLTPFSPFKQSQQKIIDAETNAGLSKDDGGVETCKQDDKGYPELYQSSANEQQDTGGAVSLINDFISERDKSPIHSVVKSKPTLYESLVCEDSNSQASMISCRTQAKQTAPPVLSHQRLSELQDTSQITNSGTPFHIHLPQSSLHPQFSMIPPSQRPIVTNPTESVQQQKAPQSGSNSSSSSDVPMVSTSELDTSVFKSPTPSEISENQNQKAAAKNLGPLYPATQDATSSTETHKVDGDASINIDEIAPVNDDQTITSEHAMEVNVAEAEIDVNKGTISDRSPAPNTLLRQGSCTSNSSPRMCLSLKKVKVTSSNARQLLNMNTAEDKNPLETSAQFELGVGVESQFHLPVIQVPSDSQFELSGDSQTLFQIQNTTSDEPTAQAPISSSQKQPEKRGTPSSTVFAVVNPAQSSHQAIKKAKKSNLAETLSPPAQEIVPNQNSGNDPYAYDSQNVDSEVDFIMQRKVMRVSSGPNRKKAPKIVNESHSTVQNPDEQGGHKEDEAPENVPVFSSEPPSQSIADIRRPQIQQPPSHTLPLESGVQNTAHLDRSGLQSATGNRENIASGSQPQTTTTGTSRSPFVSPAIILPSTSAGTLPFMSPSAAVPSSLVDELKKRAGLERGGDYQLKLVKVVCTIRHVFAEDVREGNVVQNSGRSWIIEHSPPSTHSIEEICLLPAITSSNQTSPVSFSCTLSSSNYYQHSLSSSNIIPIPLIPQPILQPSPPVPDISQGSVQTPPVSTVTSSPVIQPGIADVSGTHSRTNGAENVSEHEAVPPLTGDLPLNSQQRKEEGERSASNVHTLPSTRKETHSKNPPQNVNSNTVHSDRDGAAPGNEDVIEDTCCDNPGNIDSNKDSNGSDSDSVIVLQGSTPAAQRTQSDQPAQLDSSEDFQESPLPRTPKKTPAKKATPQRGLTSAASKESPHTRAPGAKKVIVTRNVTSTRGNKDSFESGGSVREFRYWRSVAWAHAKNRPQSSSASTVKQGQAPKPPSSKKAAASITTATPTAKTSSDNDKQLLASRYASSAKPTPTIKPTGAGKSTATVQTATATNKASSAKSATTPTTTTTTTKPTRNVTTGSTPTSRPACTASAKPTPSSKPSRPTAFAASAKSTPTTKCTPSSKPPGRAAARGNTTTRSSQGNSVSGVATPSQNKNTNKSQRRGTKRHLAEEDDEAQTDAASSRKKAKSLEPGCQRKDGVTSEIALAHDCLATCPEASMSSGSMVMAVWGDGNWYPANVLSEDKNGKYSIMYADGDTGVVPRSNMFPLDYLELDVPVMILANKQFSQSKSSGLFAGFNKDSAQQFFIEDASHMKHSYDLARLCLPQESADICLIKHTGQPYFELSRKRSRSSMLASPRDRETGPTVKKKKISFQCEEDVSPEQTSLFHGYTFMLTQKTKTDERSATPPMVPINRDVITQQVINRRGKIVDDYDEDTPVFHGRFFVLSNTCCRTHKYLIGLALGVPCISYGWIKDCIEEGRVLDHSTYILPAGHDQSDVIQWSPKDNTDILQGITVHVFSTDKKFKDHWKAVLRAANAKTCSRLPSSNKISRSKSAAEPCNIVVVSELRYVTKTLIHHVSSSGMKLVNTEWIVQSLIHGKARTDYKRFSLK